MDVLHDISKIPLELNRYDGTAEKTAMRVDGHRYMLKFGENNPVKRWPSQTSYTNTPVNEYLGSHIFASAGIPTQKTSLCTYKERSCVACRDFVDDSGPGSLLVPFRQLETSMPGESSRSSRIPSWEFVSHVFEDHPMLEPIRDAALKAYRQTICIDALIGNFDRHAGNWGYLSFDDGRSVAGPAPVYDCGSSLYSQASEETISHYLADYDSAVRHICNRPPMCLTLEGKRLKYDEFLLSEVGKPFREELVELWSSIDLDRIDAIIDDTPGTDELHRRFFKQTIGLRYDLILRPAYEMAVQEG